MAATVTGNELHCDVRNHDVEDARVRGVGEKQTHDFARVRSVADYQRRVPLREYEAFWADYWRGPYPALRGVIRVPTAPQLAQRDPGVMFQKIIYDGLVGHSFLRNFAVTFDLPNERLIFSTLFA